MMSRTNMARAWIVAVWAVLFLPVGAVGQEFVRVPQRQSHTDVKADASSGSIVLVLIPSGTTLPVVKREGEWIQVKLSPELRKTGIPMRWYENETLGFVHESTVEVLKGAPPPVPPLLPEPPSNQPPREYVRVPARQTNANVHLGPGSESIVLVLAPAGAVLPIIGRRGEWIQVRLSPELRRIGSPLRWYKNEDSGFVHESTIEVFKK
jgi:uncharacterized protein YgiM (DUF1202 family)